MPWGRCCSWHPCVAHVCMCVRVFFCVFLCLALCSRVSILGALACGMVWSVLWRGVLWHRLQATGSVSPTCYDTTLSLSQQMELALRKRARRTLVRVWSYEGKMCVQWIALPRKQKTVVTVTPCRQTSISARHSQLEGNAAGNVKEEQNTNPIYY